MKEMSPVERVAFGQKMAAARAAKRAEKQAAEPVEAVSAVEDTQDMAASTPLRRLQEEGARPAPARKTFATAADVPEGVRPISGRRNERLIDASSLEQTPDSGYASGDGGAAIVVESGQVVGAAGAVAATRARVNANGRTVTGPGQSAAQVRGGVMFSDKAGDGGFSPDRISQRGRTGPAEPTGLPCVCVMPTKLRGQDPNITWCVTCGGERDGATRPENALRGKSIRDIKAAMAGDTTAIDYNAMSEQVARLVLESIDYEAIAAVVVGVLDERAQQFAEGEHSVAPV